MIRVLVADDQPLVRSGIRMIVDGEADITVVAEAGDGAEAVAAADRHRLDVVVMDIQMPRMDGLRATEALLSGSGCAPSPKVIVLTTFDDDEYVYEALRLGASGYLLKSLPTEHLAAAIRTVAEGDALLAPTVTRRLIDRFASRPHADAGQTAALDSLTPREREVLLCIAGGRSNAEIAAQLVLSTPTIKSHVASLLAKLGLRDRTQAVILAYETGLVTPGASVSGG